jgi:hypothetical protein
MNKKEFLKNRAEYNRLTKYVDKLFGIIESEREYYRTEIEQNDYNDDDIWAIVKGSLNNTELAILKLCLKYTCDFRIERYYINRYDYDELDMNFNEIMIGFMKYNLQCYYLTELDYDEYKTLSPHKKYGQFTRFIDVLNEFKQFHQLELLHLDPIDIFNYDFCDETTSILLSSDSETDEDDEPDEPEEPVE